jgi:WD40 repeat protein
MKLQPQRKKLKFALSGNILIHSSEEKVSVWDVAHSELRYSCPGYLIGQSLDNRTFLTHRAEGNDVSGWELTTGNELALTDISPDTYPLHQRVVITGKEFPPELYVYDTFGVFRPKTFRLRHRHGAWLENWAIIPSEVYLNTRSCLPTCSLLEEWGIISKRSSNLIVYTLWGDIAGHDWAGGVFFDLNRRKRVFDGFAACRFSDPPTLYFSVNHNLLISGGQSRFELYDFSTGQFLQSVSVYGGGGSVVSVHPQHKWLVASNAEDPQNAIRLIDTRSSNSEGEIKRVIPEEEPIEYLEFHPEGRILASLLKNDEIHFWDVHN